MPSHVQIQEQSSQQFQAQMPPVMPQGGTSILFNKAGLPLTHLQTSTTSVNDFETSFPGAKDTLGDDDLEAIITAAEDLKAKAAAAKLMGQTEKMRRMIVTLQSRIETLSDTGAPGIGSQFNTRLREANCTVLIRPDLLCSAEYVSFSYAPENRGFPNQISLNPFRVTNIQTFAGSVNHEGFHAFQKHAALALHSSPFNPDTRRVVHPADWLMLEALCERDAIAKTAYINLLLAKDDPTIHDHTQYDVVTTREFEALLKKHSLENALVIAALQSLNKPYREGDNSFTFVDHYHGVALKNFAAGMAMRAYEKEQGLMFFRLRNRHFRDVGNYHVGPNALGEYFMEPKLLERPKLSAAHQTAFDALCEKYKIPPLKDCPYLDDQTCAATPEQPSSTPPHDKPTGRQLPSPTIPAFGIA